MKKITVIIAAAMVAVAFTSCKTTKDSAYRKAYEKAMQQNQVIEQQPQQETAVVSPLVERQVVNNTPTVTTPANTDDVAVRQEKLTVVNGAGLKEYSVVVGSFGVQANAEGLMARLKAAGHDAQIAFNGKMYRVIIGTYDSKAQAVTKRNNVSAEYEGAWLLYNK